jgi:NitT/TauT family transport system substrate-binding protein
MRGTLGLVVGVWLGLLAGATARAEALRVLVDGAWAPHHAPLFLAQERGYFREAGLDPLIEPSLGSNSVAVMVGQRSFDLGLVPASIAATAVSRGVPVRMVAVIQPRTTLSVVGLAEKVKLEGPASLAGLRLGVTPGGNDSLAMTIFRRANNIGISALLIMPTENAAKLPALLAGRLDAVVGGGPALASALRAEGQAPSVMPLASHGVALIGLGFVAQRQAVTADAELLRRGLGAIRRGFAAAVAAPGEACAAMQRATAAGEGDGTCQDALTAFLATTAPAGEPGWGRQDGEAWARMIEAMRAAGEIQGTRPASFYFTNDVVP